MFSIVSSVRSWVSRHVQPHARPRALVVDWKPIGPGELLEMARRASAP
jgi:hypothetical protein